MLEPSTATITAIVTNDAEMSPAPRPVSPWPACYQIVQGGVNKNPPTQQQANMLDWPDIKYWYCASAADNQ